MMDEVNASMSPTGESFRINLPFSTTSTIPTNVIRHPRTCRLPSRSALYRIPPKIMVSSGFVHTMSETLLLGESESAVFSAQK